MLYFMVPFIGWIVSGTLKFVINYFRYGKKAKEKIGNGGFPSTHTTVMTTPTALIAFTEGIQSPVFGIGVAVTFIVILDAIGIRRAVGIHASLLNNVAEKVIVSRDGFDFKKLRESMGHNHIEVLGGVLLGVLLAYLIFRINEFINIL